MATVKRKYDSVHRREQAQATQLRVLAAARDLMLERGYAATTMSSVAESAGVAVQTIYSATGGGKARLAKWVWDATLAGDIEPIPFGARPQVQAVFAEPDPAVKLALYAGLSRQVYERLGPVARVLRAGADAGDDELRDLVDTTERERLTGTTNLSRHLHDAGALRPGLSAERAGHRLWALNAGEVADGLTLRCGWTLDDYQRWLAEAMIASLLTAAHPASSAATVT